MDTKKEKTHGNYKDTAEMSQSLKGVMMVSKNWDALTSPQRKSLEMIAVKIARILSGDSSFREHWDGIEGYAELGGANSPPSMPQIALDLSKAMGN